MLTLCFGTSYTESGQLFLSDYTIVATDKQKMPNKSGIYVMTIKVK